MDKKWIMGLDIGTASCALSAYECNDDTQPTTLAFLDGVVFSEPIKEKDLSLLNQERRTKRMARRQIARRASRKRKLLHIALTLKLDEAKLKSHQSANNIHQLRVDAINEKLDEYQLFAVFLHMLQNRGANHLKENDPTLAKEMHTEADGNATLLSAYLLKRKQEAQTDRKPWRKLEESDDTAEKQGKKTYYYARFLLEKEFKQIIECQKHYHDFLKQPYTDYPDGALNKSDNTLITYQNALHQTIIEQRPLKWDIKTIGDCTYKENCKVASKAHPDFQDFRIETQIANLTFANGERLNPSQKQILRAALQATDELSFKAIYELLNIQENFTIDTATNTNTTLMGNKTDHAMQKLGLEASKWFGMSDAEKSGAITVLSNLSDFNYIKEHSFDFLSDYFEKILTVDKSYLYDKKTCQAITHFLLNLSKHPDFTSLTALGLEKGRANYSARAYNELADAMKANDCDETMAKEKLEYTPLDLDDVITNPIVLKAIRQVSALYKEAVKKMGGTHPSHISIELMRELKQSSAKRNETNAKINRNKTRRQKAVAELDKHGIPAAEKNVRRYNLAAEQAFKCAYTGGCIAVSDLDNYEIDHIIPRAKGGKNGYSNLVLANKNINQKKDNLTPYQAWQAGFINENGWKHITRIAKTYIKDFDDEKKKKTPQGYEAILYRKGKLLISQDDPRMVETDTGGEEQDRRFTETAYIARLLTSKLQKWSNLPAQKIIPIRGSITGNLRKQWQIDSILPEIRIKEGRPLYSKDGDIITTEEYYDSEKQKEERYKFGKRCDHRHHFIDAAVIGLCNRAMLQKTSTAHGRDFRTEPLIFENPIADLRSILLNYLTNFVVWQKPDRMGGGAFFEETLYAKTDDDLLLKRESIASFMVGSDYEQTIEKLEKRVYDDRFGTKKSIITQLQQKQQQGIELKIAMQQLYHPIDSKNHIKKVKAIYYGRGAIKYKEDLHYYNPINNSVQLHDGYACAMIDEHDAKQKVTLITKAQYKTNPKYYRQHGIFISDIVFHKKTQKFYEVCSYHNTDGILYKLANETQPFGSIKQKELKLKTRFFADFEIMRTKPQLYAKLKQLR